MVGHPSSQGETACSKRPSPLHAGRAIPRGNGVPSELYAAGSQGSTLEVSAGTGRNLPYYRYGDLSSLTLMDSSANMLERAYDKLQKIPEARGLNVLLCQGNAESLCECSHAADGPMNGTRGCNIVPCPSPLPGGKYDTVIDTFGLCSHEDPVQVGAWGVAHNVGLARLSFLLAGVGVTLKPRCAAVCDAQVLKEMARCCKPGGNILLIEHGRADWEWLNSLLDRDAEKHFTRWGCWWNRDILGLVGKAGLKVNSTQRWHFGTTYVIHATTPDANDAT